MTSGLRNMVSQPCCSVSEALFSQFQGDIVYFEILGQPFLILGSLRRTTDLFDKRSSKYSNRPRFPMLVELLSQAFYLKAALIHAISTSGWVGVTRWR